MEKTIAEIPGEMAEIGGIIAEIAGMESRPNL